MAKKLNESIKRFPGKFVNSTTFIGPDGKPYDLIPSVLEDPQLSDEDKEKINQFDTPSGEETGMDWEGETEEVNGKVVIDVQTPDASKTFIDDETGIAYKWNESSQRFEEVEDDN